MKPWGMLGQGPGPASKVLILPDRTHVTSPTESPHITQGLSVKDRFLTCQSNLLKRFLTRGDELRSPGAQALAPWRPQPVAKVHTWPLGHPWSHLVLQTAPNMFLTTVLHGTAWQPDNKALPPSSRRVSFYAVGWSQLFLPRTGLPPAEGLAGHAA